MNRASFWDKRCKIPEILIPLEKQLDKVSRGYILKEMSQVPQNQHVKKLYYENVEIEAKNLINWGR